MDDTELLRRYADEGSEKAFAEVVRRHLSLVYFAALRRLGGDAHRAEDVAQLVFAQLARQARVLSRRPALAGWLYTTTRYLALQSIRAERRRAAREAAAMSLEENEPTAELDWNRLRPVIDRVLDELGERDREIILQRFFQGQTFPEIATQLRVTPDAVRFRVSRTLARMRERLRRHGVLSTGVALEAILAAQAEAAVPGPVVGAVLQGAMARAAEWASAGSWLTRTIELMSTTKVAAAAVIVAACISGSLLQNGAGALRAEKDRLGAVRTQRDASVMELESVRRQASKADAELLAAVQKGGVSNRAGAAAGAASSVLGTKRGASARAGAKAGTTPHEIDWALSRDPAVRAALSAWIKNAFNSLWGPFFRSAVLTPEQRSGLADLILQHDINMGVAWLSLRPEGVPAEAVDSQIQSLLGDRAYQQYQEYGKTQFLRVMAIGLAGQVYNTGTPLTAGQADQLTQILADNSSVYQAGSPPFPNSVDWDKALLQAGKILSPLQMAALQSEATLLSGTAVGINPARPGAFANGAEPPSWIYHPEGLRR